MPRLFSAFLVLALVLLPGLVWAQEPAPLFDPQQLPAISGQVQLFTLTSRGDIDGFVLRDGTEVKTPPHLTAQLAATIRPGDQVTIHGLKAASLPLVQAMSVTNDATGRSVVDAGPDRRSAGRPSPAPEGTTAPPRSVSIAGRIRMTLHGPRGDINGILLEDGSVLRLPPPEAERVANLLVPGQVLRAEGVSRDTAVGSVVDLTAVGASMDRMTPIHPDPEPRPPV